MAAARAAAAARVRVSATGRAGGAGGLRRLGAGRLIKAPRAESRSGTARSRFDFFLNNSDVEKKNTKRTPKIPK